MTASLTLAIRYGRVFQANQSGTSAGLGCCAVMRALPGATTMNHAYMTRLDDAQYLAQFLHHADAANLVP
jgi:hypothetical protein